MDWDRLEKMTCLVMIQKFVEWVFPYLVLDTGYTVKNMKKKTATKEKFGSYDPLITESVLKSI